MKRGPQQNLIRYIIVIIRSEVLYDQHLWLLATAQFLFLKSDKSVFGLHWREKTKDQQSKRGLIWKKKKRFKGGYLVKCRNENKNNWIMLHMTQKVERFQPNSSPSFPTKEASFYFRWERTGFKLPPSFVSFLGTFINVSHFLPNVFIKLGENWSRSFNIG